MTERPVAEGSEAEPPASEGSLPEDLVFEGSVSQGALPDGAVPEDSLPEGAAVADGPPPDAATLLAAERESLTRASLDAERDGGGGRDAAPPVDPEWRLIVVRVDAVGDAASTAGDGEPRYALVRWADGAPLQLLGVAAPGPFEELDQVVGDALRTQLGLEPVGAVLLSERRIPRRAAQWRVGRVATGWERAVAIRAQGVPLAQPPLFEVELLTLAEADVALATSVERELLGQGVGLL